MGLSLFTPTMLLSHPPTELLSRHNTLSPVWLRAPGGLYQGFRRRGPFLSDSVPQRR